MSRSSTHYADEGTFELAGKTCLLVIPEDEEELGVHIAHSLASYERGRMSFQQAFDHIMDSIRDRIKL